MVGLALLLVVPALASMTHPKPSHFNGNFWSDRPQLETRMELETIPMRMYKQDCWKKRPIALTALSRHVYWKVLNPGAGMEPEAIEPFTKVLKDGFYEVDCIKDYMYAHGDAFGG